MLGMDATTGAPLGGTAHLEQSIRDILSTPIGSRVLRRDYGSRIPALLDAPLGDGLAIDLVAATAEALARWEPRFRLTRVEVVEATAAGRMGIVAHGDVVATTDTVSVEVAW